MSMVPASKQDESDAPIPAGRVIGSGYYDPLLAQVSGRGRWQNYIDGGFKLWPLATSLDCRPRILLLGNSSSMWPEYPFAIQAGELLARRGMDVHVINGSARGHTSSQELLRVVRDATALRPNIIFSLSGICDLGYLQYSNPHNPFFHKDGRLVAAAVRAAGLAKHVSAGVHEDQSPAQMWCRNNRMARILAEDMGAIYISGLQPVLGYGRYNMTEQDRELFQSKRNVVLSLNQKTYGDSVQEFYDEVKAIVASDPRRHSHVWDLTDVYDGAVGAYTDHRHPSAAGCSMIAPVLAERWLNCLRSSG